MKDLLPKNPLLNESAAVNLDVSSGCGTHWVCYYKIGPLVDYYDSSAFAPPIEIKKYFKGCTILYNYEDDQKLWEINCGYRCIHFLYNKWMKKIEL